jgi:hypothetical protein
MLSMESLETLDRIESLRAILQCSSAFEASPLAWELQKAYALAPTALEEEEHCFVLGGFDLDSETWAPKQSYLSQEPLDVSLD